MCSADDHPGRTSTAAVGIIAEVAQRPSGQPFSMNWCATPTTSTPGISLKAARPPPAGCCPKPALMANCRPVCWWARRTNPFWPLSYLCTCPARAPGDFGVQRHQYSIKAAPLGLAAEDYFNDQVLEDTDPLYSGAREIDQGFWGKRQKPQILARRAVKLLPHERPRLRQPLLNEILWQGGEAPFAARVLAREGKTITLETPQRLQPQQTQRMGVTTARNREQNFVLNLLMNPEIDFCHRAGPGWHRQTLLSPWLPAWR